MIGLARAVVVLSVGCASAFGQLGPIAPPAGPVVDTGPHLGEIEPRTPIGEDTTPGDASALYVITEPGSYYLTGDVSVAGDGQEGIRIESDDVTIDLLGFTLRSTAASPGNGIEIQATSGVRVLNGTIRDFEGGIIGRDADRGRFERLRLEKNAGQGLDVGESAAVIDCLSIENAGSGIVVRGGSMIRGCTASFNRLAGFGAGGANVTISDCTANQNSAAGFDVGAFVTFRGCLSSLNGGAGISSLQTVSIVDCSAIGNTGIGFDLVTDAFVSGCLVNRNLSGGIETSLDSHVTGCLVEDNTGIGIDVTSDCRVERCTVTDNSQGGIDALRGTTIDSNTLAGNGGFGIRADGGIIIRNTLSGNASPQVVVGASKYGPIVTPVNEIMTSSPWANIEY